MEHPFFKAAVKAAPVKALLTAVPVILKAAPAMASDQEKEKVKVKEQCEADRQKDTEEQSRKIEKEKEKEEKDQTPEKAMVTESSFYEPWVRWVRRTRPAGSAMAPAQTAPEMASDQEKEEEIQKVEDALFWQKAQLFEAEAEKGLEAAAALWFEADNAADYWQRTAAAEAWHQQRLVMLRHQEALYPDCVVCLEESATEALWNHQGQYLGPAPLPLCGRCHRVLVDHERPEEVFWWPEHLAFEKVFLQRVREHVLHQKEKEAVRQERSRM